MNLKSCKIITVHNTALLVVLNWPFLSYMLCHYVSFSSTVCHVSVLSYICLKILFIPL